MDIVQLAKKDRKNLMKLYRIVTADLKKSDVHQWDWLYPNHFVIYGDVKRGTAFGIRDGDLIIGAVIVDQRQSARYNRLSWLDKTTGDPACIHRLSVHPAYQGLGIGKRLLQFTRYNLINSHIHSPIPFPK